MEASWKSIASTAMLVLGLPVLASAQVSRSHEVIGPDGRPGLPVPAMRFPSELRSQVRLDTSAIRQLRRLPESIPGQPLPAMVFPDELKQPTLLDSVLTRYREGKLNR